MPRKILYFLLLLVLSVSVMAQTKGRIKGTVVDQQTGEPLIGANVMVMGTSNGASANANGEYDIVNVETGAVDIQVSYIGYQSLIKRNVRINAGLTAYENFQLVSEEISTGTVEIVAKRTLIQKDATSSVQITNSDDIKNLPVRGLQNIVSLQAGVVISGGNITIRGSRSDEVGYFLEGVNIGDPSGGTRITLGNDALEEVAVETGAMTAEYGGASAGMVRSQLRSGGTKYNASLEYRTDNVFFQSKDNFFNQTKKLGTYWHGINQVSFVLSGPVPFTENKVKFFYNLENYFERTGTRKDEPGYDFGVYQTYPNNPTINDAIEVKYPAGVRYNDHNNRFTHSASLTFDFNPVRVRLGGTFNSQEWWTGSTGVGDFTDGNALQFLRNRSTINKNTNSTITLQATHVLSPSMFYELSGGYTYFNQKSNDQYMGDDWLNYGDSVANAAAGITWVRTKAQRESIKNLTAIQKRYTPTSSYNFYNTFINTPYQGAGAYSLAKTSAISARGVFTILTKYHTLKIGGEYKQTTVRRWAVGSQTSFAKDINIRPSGQTYEQALNFALYRYGVNNYGYDIYGNETDESGVYAPKKPVEAGFFIQDKIDFGDLILNVGLRYDYFDIDNLKFKDPTKPELAFGPNSTAGILNIDGFEKTKSFSSLSPRISVNFPVTDKTVFKASFGKFVAQPSVNQSYIGYHALATQIGGGYFYTNTQGLDLIPTRVTDYSVGFSQELTDFLAMEIAGFLKDTKGQIQYIQVDTDKQSPYKSYGSMANGDFSTTKGVEVTLTMRRYERLQAKGYIAFTDAAGTGTNPNSAAGIVGAPLDGVTVFRPLYVSPLGQNRAIAGNIMLDYRFGNDDGGPVFSNFGINLMARFDSGSPFTRGVGGADMESQVRSRTAVEYMNASTTPARFTLDLRIDKSFNIYDRLNANIYLVVNNLLDARNVNSVYSRTGSASDDGFITNPDFGGKKIEEYGPQYEQLYKTLDLLYNGKFSDIRQILLGIRLEY